jgi:hypothetical protein
VLWSFFLLWGVLVIQERRKNASVLSEACKPRHDIRYIGGEWSRPYPAVHIAGDTSAVHLMGDSFD